MFFGVVYKYINLTTMYANFTYKYCDNEYW